MAAGAVSIEDEFDEFDENNLRDIRKYGGFLNFRPRDI